MKNDVSRFSRKPTKRNSMCRHSGQTKFVAKNFFPKIDGVTVVTLFRKRFHVGVVDDAAQSDVEWAVWRCDAVSQKLKRRVGNFIASRSLDRLWRRRRWRVSGASRLGVVTVVAANVRSIERHCRRKSRRWVDVKFPRVLGLQRRAWMPQWPRR